MSWSDILYPGNADRRSQVVAKLQQLEDAMADNFRATNKLATYLNDQVPTANLPRIVVNSSKSLGENADVLVKQVDAIEAVIVKIDDQLKEKLEPDLYKKITNVDLSFEERIEIGQQVTDLVAGITGSTIGAVVGELAAKKLTSVITSKAARIAASTLAGAVAGGLAGVAIDVIVGAITGAVARDQLEEALSALQQQVEEFIPASDEYSDNILEVLAAVRVWEKRNKK